LTASGSAAPQDLEDFRVFDPLGDHVRLRRLRERDDRRDDAARRGIRSGLRNDGTIDLDEVDFEAT
jgi:hypothetical protein